MKRRRLLHRQQMACILNPLERGILHAGLEQLIP
jgi:hypothetical protein